MHLGMQMQVWLPDLENNKEHNILSEHLRHCASAMFILITSASLCPNHVYFAACDKARNGHIGNSNFRWVCLLEKPCQACLCHYHALGQLSLDSPCTEGTMLYHCWQKVWNLESLVQQRSTKAREGDRGHVWLWKVETIKVAEPEKAPSRFGQFTLQSTTVPLFLLPIGSVWNYARCWHQTCWMDLWKNGFQS